MSWLASAAYENQLQVSWTRRGILSHESFPNVNKISLDQFKISAAPFTGQLWSICQHVRQVPSGTYPGSVTSLLYSPFLPVARTVLMEPCWHLTPVYQYSILYWYRITLYNLQCCPWSHSIITHDVKSIMSMILSRI